ncbi:NUDIX domain-containing protein [Nonomuraea sp. NPDC003709]|uniref:NUDIX hydrolase n=1 Tax=unclassified Nonomuraea TaxID=2593643 RepID=UPI0033A56B60
MSGPRIRVAAYVLRYRSTPELLVFDHVGAPEAGTQVPAGGVLPDESLEQAVLREVAEETGLTEVAIVGPIAVDHRPREDNGHPRHTTFFQLTADPDSADAWHHRVHGDGADAGMEFACRFVPLPLVEGLADAQDAWLSRIDGRGGKAVSSS